MGQYMKRDYDYLFVSLEKHPPSYCPQALRGTDVKMAFPAEWRPGTMRTELRRMHATVARVHKVDGKNNE